MRGTDKPQVTMLSLVTPDKRVPADHPVRRIKVLADQALAALSPTFDQMYRKVGRPSMARSDPTRLTSRRPIRRRSWLARATTSRPS